MTNKSNIYLLGFLFLFLVADSVMAQGAPVPTPDPDDGYSSEAPIRSKQKEAKKGQLIVKLTKGAKRKLRKQHKRKTGKKPSRAKLRKLIARSMGLRKVDELQGNTVFVKGRRVNNLKVDRAKKRKILERAEENLKLFSYETSLDILYLLGFQHGLNNTGTFGTAGIDIEIEEAWDVTLGSPDLVVGVIDTGITQDHADLVNNLFKNPKEIPGNGLDDDDNGFIDDVQGWDFINGDNNPDDDNSHGSHVAGTIAAERNNFDGFAVGVAPNVKVLGLKILNAEGAGDIAGLIKAIDYAVALKKSGVNLRVLNASLGGPGGTDAVREAIQRANQAGIVFVAAAGNNSTDNDVEEIFPAGYDLPNIISVAALNASGQLAGFSNFGLNSVDVGAPGDFIWSTFIFNFYFPMSGTSMAAPHVAGVAALVLSDNPNLTPSQVRTRILNSVTPLDNLNGTMQSPGIVSAFRALRP